METIPTLIRTRDQFLGALGGAPWQRRLAAACRSSWTLGLLAAVLTWNVVFTPPFTGLDPSWTAGLYIAAHRGLQFGTQVIFTYGPLGFLAQPWMWYSGLSEMAFVYQAILHVLLCVSLVCSLRRTLHPVLAVVATFFVLVTTDGLDVAVVLAAVWCFALLAPDPPVLARRVVVFGGAVLGAAETLIYARTGLLVLAMSLVALLAGAQRRRDASTFAGITILAFCVLWFAAGQGVSNFPDFVSRSVQIISGYSQAMGVQAESASYRWWAIVAGLVLVAASAATSSPGRARWGAILLTVITAFVLFKEGSVRAEIGHTRVFFLTLGGLFVALSFGRRRWLAIAAVAAAVGINVQLTSVAHVSADYNPLTYVRRTSDQVRLLFNPGQRKLEAGFFFLVEMQQQYDLPKALLSLVKGHTVQIDPEEVAALWAYGLASNWVPGPVLQDYSAYTSGLDRLEAQQLSSASAPQRILRWSVPQSRATYPQTSIDGRLTSWDPPAKYLAMICHYVALGTQGGWQVLAHVPDRCGPARLIASMPASFGSTIAVPQATPGTIVFASIHGAGVSGFEQLRTLLFRARFRFAEVNGNQTYRLVPGTAQDGLIMNAAPGVDYPLPFAIAPGARTIRLLGSTGALRFEFFSMRVRPR